MGRCPVAKRLVTAVVSASLVAASCSGCFLQDNKVTQKTARITVDNNTPRTSHAVTCSQVEWLLTADIDLTPRNTAAPQSVRVLLKLEPDKPKVESIHIDNVDGFSGVADSGAGDSKVAFANNSYTIKGRAEKSQVDDPRVFVTVPFTIEVGC
jgi:ipoprotein LpqH